MAESRENPFVPPPSTRDLGHPLLRSVVLHAVIALALWAAFGAQSRKIEAQELRVRVDLARVQEEIAQEQASIQEEVAQEAARDEVRMMLTALMHDAVVEEDLGALLDRMETSLDDLFADHHGHDSWLETDADRRAQLRDEAMAQLRQDQQDLLARTVVAQIRAHVRDQLVPELAAEIENRLKNTVGKEVEKHVTKTLDQAQREKKLEDVDRRTAAAAASDAIETQVAAVTARAIAEELVPHASKRVMDAFAKELQKLPLNSDQLHALVQEDIRNALTEELLTTDPAATPVTAALAQRHQLADAVALDRAHSAVSNARDQMQMLADQQRDIREQPPTASLAKQPAQHAQVTAITAAQAAARDALTTAHQVTADDKALRDARKHTSESQAIAEASKAEKALRNNLSDEAAAAMTASEDQLRATAAALDQAAQAIATQAEAAHALEALPMTASAAAAAAAEAAATAASETAVAETTKAVVGAAQQIKIGTLLGDTERLQRLAELGKRLDEASAKLADGRSVGAPSLLPGANLLAGDGRPGLSGTRSTRNRARINREAYEKFVKDLRNRMNPDNAYGDVEAVAGLATRHRNVPKEVAEQAWIADFQHEKLDRLQKPTEDQPERKLEDPDFPTPAWGGAPMIHTAPVIDGDLSDWGELTHGLPIRWNGDDATTLHDTGITVHLRWSTKGLFAAYRVPKSSGISLPKAHTPYDGDSCEWWLDLDNSRRSHAGKSETAHQFMMAPFGVEGDNNKRFFEFLHGQRGLTGGLHDRTGKGFAAARHDGDGYTVEVFIDRSALVKPSLLPGQVLAMNFSVNLGFNIHADHWQWAASKAIGTFIKPDTWGDVVLLGADATLRFTDAVHPDQTAEWILPGQPLGVEIADADMNLRDDLRDRVAATVGIEGRSERLFVILEETGVDTGVFRASVDTQAFIDTADERTLGARSGSVIALTYQDPRAAYGEQNREIAAWLPVAFPAQRFAPTAESKEP